MLGLAIAFAAYFLLPLFKQYNIGTGASVLAILAIGIPSLFLMVVQNSIGGNLKYLRISSIIALITYVISLTLGISKYLSFMHVELHIIRVSLILPVVWSLWLIIRDNKGVQSEVTPRTLLLCLSTYSILVVLLIEDFVFFQSEIDKTMMLINSSINVALIFSLRFLISKHDLFQIFPLNEKRKQESEKTINIETKSESQVSKILAEKIDRAILDEKLFLLEGFNINQLAKKIGEQPYRVRKYINQELNYRNFSKFLNYYRIEHAKKLLLSPEFYDRKVFSVALEVGYSSISPFNRAFKEETGLTPSEYRKGIELKNDQFIFDGIKNEKLTCSN